MGRYDQISMSDDKIIREGGYQPTEDPPAQPPSSVVKPAETPEPPPPSQSPPAGQSAPPSQDE